MTRLLLFPLLSLASCLLALASAAESRPNILILYADDMGYGDLGIQNPASKIPTPHLDRLAQEGIRFTDGHSSSGICTPSRYALLTGRHHWRDFHGIVGALGDSVFKPERLTLPEMLQEIGYTTACIGKWHLGWDWSSIRKPDAKPVMTANGKRKTNAWPHDAFDWSKPIADGPLAHGFDHYFGDTVINMPPYCWINDDKVTEAPNITFTAGQHKAKTKEGSWEARPGPALADWDFYQVLPTFEKKGVEYIKSRNKDKPWFLYFPLPSPHAPIVPIDEFDGTSQAGPYGDFVVQSDHVCGQLLQALRDTGQMDNTLIIFTADNGPEKYAYARDEKFDHWSSTPFRGLKRDIYEGGHHVPFIIKPHAALRDQLAASREKGNTLINYTVKGPTCDALVSQIDFMATIADLLDYKLPVKNAAEDSHNLLPLLTGATMDHPRTSHVHNTSQNKYAIRDGDWLLIDHKDGYTSGRNKDWEKKHKVPADDKDPTELYDLKQDIGQKNNLAKNQPEKVKELQSLLKKIRQQGFSAPRLEQ